MLSQKQFAELALGNRPRRSESESAYGQRLSSLPELSNGFQGSGASRTIPRAQAPPGELQEQHLQQGIAAAEATPFKAGDPEWWDTVITTILRVGGPVAAGAAATIAAPATMGGSFMALPAVLGVGSVAGDVAAQNYEIARGLREDWNPATTLVEGALGTVPLFRLGRAGRVAQNMAMGGAGAGATAWTERGEAPSVQEIAIGTGLGGVIGEVGEQVARRLQRGASAQVPSRVDAEDAPTPIMSEEQYLQTHKPELEEDALLRQLGVARDDSGNLVRVVDQPPAPRVKEPRQISLFDTETGKVAEGMKPMTKAQRENLEVDLRKQGKGDLSKDFGKKAPAIHPQKQQIVQTPSGDVAGVKPTLKHMFQGFTGIKKAGDTWTSLFKLRNPRGFAAQQKDPSATINMIKPQRQELDELARRGFGGKDFYEWQRQIDDLYPGQEKLSADLFAATSPNNELTDNLDAMADVLERHNIGIQLKEGTGFMKSHADNIARAQRGELLSGDKVGAFQADLRAGLAGAQHSSNLPTIDSWMAAIYGLNPSKALTPANYKTIAQDLQNRVKGTGKRMNLPGGVDLTPRQYQAAIWAGVRGKDELPGVMLKNWQRQGNLPLNDRWARTMTESGYTRRDSRGRELGMRIGGMPEDRQVVEQIVDTMNKEGGSSHVLRMNARTGRLEATDVVGAMQTPGKVKGQASIADKWIPQEDTWTVGIAQHPGSQKTRIKAKPPAGWTSMAKLGGAEKERMVDDLLQFSHRNSEELAKPGRALGTWKDSATGTTHFDVVDLVTGKSAAIKRAKANGQLAIFNPKTFKEERIDLNNADISIRLAREGAVPSLRIAGNIDDKGNLLPITRSSSDVKKAVAEGLPYTGPPSEYKGPLQTVKGGTVNVSLVHYSNTDIQPSAQVYAKGGILHKIGKGDEVLLDPQKAGTRKYARLNEEMQRREADTRGAYVPSTWLHIDHPSAVPDDVVMAGARKAYTTKISGNLLYDAGTDSAGIYSGIQRQYDDALKIYTRSDDLNRRLRWAKEGSSEQRKIQAELQELGTIESIEDPLGKLPPLVVGAKQGRVENPITPGELQSWKERAVIAADYTGLFDGVKFPDRVKIFDPIVIQSVSNLAP